RCGGARAVHRRDRSGAGVRECHGGVRSAAPLRRRQAIGIRPRAEHAGPAGIREREDRACCWLNAGRWWLVDPPACSHHHRNRLPTGPPSTSPLTSNAHLHHIPGQQPMHPFIETQKEYMRADVPPFRPGDTLRVQVRVKEGDKERLQAFEGVCIARRGSGVSETFTVRKVSNGVGVERIFPVHSPMLGSIIVARRGMVRRAKLYYLRNATGKAARIREKKTHSTQTSSE